MRNSDEKAAASSHGATRVAEDCLPIEHAPLLLLGESPPSVLVFVPVLVLVLVPVTHWTQAYDFEGGPADASRSQLE